MPVALAMASAVISMLPHLLAMFEQVLGAGHPDVVAANQAVTALQQAHQSAVAAAPQS